MKQGFKIFVVDDMSVIAHTLSAILREHGHKAVAYCDPLRALYDAQASMPDVLISDVEMPLMDGVDLARRILKLCPQCKVFLMSGHAGPIQKLEAARASGFDLTFFSKPLSASVITGRLESLRLERQFAIA